MAEDYFEQGTDLVTLTLQTEAIRKKLPYRLKEIVVYKI